MAMRPMKPDHRSVRLLTRPDRRDMFAAAEPWALRPISSIRALITSRPSLPLVARSCSSVVFFPVTLASKSHTGTPRSMSCRISSVCSFSFAQDWPRAVVMPFRRSMPPPSFSDWSVMACRVPSIGSSPKVFSRAKASVTSATSSGVSLANFLIQAVAFSPPSMEPIRAVSWVCKPSYLSPVCSIEAMPSRANRRPLANSPSRAFTETTAAARPSTRRPALPKASSTAPAREA
ncbi:hypothetical protein D9M70_472700 [compost metagenome]